MSDSLAARAALEGMADRVRFKARGIEPGNVVCSSAQGSDLVLDESVMIANRRGNEIHLREQDQAIVMRSLQQFHAMSGARIYAGMVQRDANILPRQMFSDGTYWDHYDLAGVEAVDVGPHCDDPIPYEAGLLTPGAIFRRTPNADGEIGTKSDFRMDISGSHIPPHLDPFNFLTWGAFISESGARSGSIKAHDGDATATQGGKVFYRTGLMSYSPNSRTKPTINAALHQGDDGLADALTEYRIEVTHTTDGVLPVTEQTDGFDAERLPESEGEGGSNSPFIEVVYGSVVGNDPFSEASLYGLPLRPTSSGLVSGVGHSLKDHAATLFRVKPIDGGDDTWVSVNKAGKVFANLANGLSLNTGGQTTIGVSGGMTLESPGSYRIVGHGTAGGNSPYGVEILSPGNAVHIFGGAPTTEGLGPSANEAGEATEDLPAINIHSPFNILMQSDRKVTINAPTLDLSDIGNLIMNSQGTISLGAGENCNTNSSTVEVTSAKRMVTSNSGGSPLDGACYEHNVICNPGTMAVPYTDQFIETMQIGSRSSSIEMGDWASEILVGNHSFSSTAGNVELASLEGTNSCKITPSGATTTVGLGNVSSTAAVGTQTLSGLAGATLMSTGGPTTVRSSSALLLGAPSACLGPLMTGQSIDPILGLPYASCTLVDYGAIRSA